MSRAGAATYATFGMIALSPLASDCAKLAGADRWGDSPLRKMRPLRGWSGASRNRRRAFRKLGDLIRMQSVRQLHPLPDVDFDPVTQSLPDPFQGA